MILIFISFKNSNEFLEVHWFKNGYLESKLFLKISKREVSYIPTALRCFGQQNPRILMGFSCTKSSLDKYPHKNNKTNHSTEKSLVWSAPFSAVCLCDARHFEIFQSGEISSWNYCWRIFKFRKFTFLDRNAISSELILAKFVRFLESPSDFDFSPVNNTKSRKKTRVATKIVVHPYCLRGLKKMNLFPIRHNFYFSCNIGKFWIVREYICQLFSFQHFLQKKNWN